MTIAPEHSVSRLSTAPEFQPLEPTSVFEPGSVVEFRFFYQPELNDTQTVRRDGMVSLPLIGDVKIAGRSPTQLRAQLEEAYAAHVREPSIAVILREDPGQQVIVGGAVGTPGPVALNQKLSVLDAMMLAGGPDLRAANVRNVIVIRGSAAERHGYALDLGPALMGEPSTPFYLEPRDIVYIPRTEIADANQWIEQHINNIVPQLGLTWDRAIGSSRFGIDTAIRRF